MDRHYFWAVKVPDETKQHVKAKLNTVISHFPFKRWVHEQDYHITLAFLGSANKKQLELCTKLIEENISEHSGFKLNIIGLNIFGPPKNPRVFWAAIQTEDRLNKLQQMVYTQCTKAEFVLEKRSYHPHLTLARQWVGSAPFNQTSLESHNPFAEAITFLADEVVLYSVNKDARPKYEAVSTLILK